MEQEREYWRYEFTAPSGKRKTIRVLHGDLCEAEEGYDVVVCSAYKGNYYPLHGTLIGALEEKRGIPVEELARRPELDLKGMGCWLSRQTGSDFRRVACVELLDLEKHWDQRACCGTLLKSTFSTMRFVLEQADLQGIPVRRVALPILGAGSQGIAVSDIAGPLINQCIQALRTVEGLETITFYERKSHKLTELTRTLERLTRPGNQTPEYQVFISYSHHRFTQAAQIRLALEGRGLRCWMAPESIPTGSDYSLEIPTVLNQVRVLMLLLTPEAETSPWVHKEVGIAIGNGRTVVPYQPVEYQLGPQFRFLLEGVQILPGWQYSGEAGLQALADRVSRVVRDRERYI